MSETRMHSGTECAHYYFIPTAYRSRAFNRGIGRRRHAQLISAPAYLTTKYANVESRTMASRSSIRSRPPVKLFLPCFP